MGFTRGAGSTISSVTGSVSGSRRNSARRQLDGTLRRPIELGEEDRSGLTLAIDFGGGKGNESRGGGRNQADGRVHRARGKREARHGNSGLAEHPGVSAPWCRAA